MARHAGLLLVGLLLGLLCPVGRITSVSPGPACAPEHVILVWPETTQVYAPEVVTITTPPATPAPDPWPTLAATAGEALPIPERITLTPVLAPTHEVQPTASPTPSCTGHIHTPRGANLRAAPDLAAAILLTLQNGTPVTAIRRVGAWWQVEAWGQRGYVWAELVAGCT